MDPRILRKRRLQKEKRRREKIRAIQSLIRLALFGVLLFIILNTLVFTIVTVDGASMNPKFYHQDRVVFSKINIDHDGLKRSEIVLFEGFDERMYIKRIVALPGEVVEIKEGQVYVNGSRLKDDINKSYTYIYNSNKWYLKDDQYFVLGDNRKQDDSKDSRIFGPINLDQIKGKFLLGL